MVYLEKPVAGHVSVFGIVTYVVAVSNTKHIVMKNSLNMTGTNRSMGLGIIMYLVDL